MKKRFLFPLLALGVPLSVGISDAAIHSIGCYSGNQGACEELSRRKLFGHEDNITDAKRCVSSKGYAGSCSRVDPQYIPADLVEPFNKAKAAFDVKMAKQKRERAIQAAALVAETKQRAAKAKAERETRGKWTYLSSPDSATGKQSKRAYLTSENSMNFSFPYSGTQYGHFTVRNHPRYGVDAFLRIDKGQLLCDNYSNTSVLVRFDNGAASTYRCNSAADHSSDIVFIEGVGRLEARMKAAKKMYVTVSVYQEGSRTWEFEVKGYDKTKI